MSHLVGLRFDASLGKAWPPKDSGFILLELDITATEGPIKCSHTGGDVWCCPEGALAPPAAAAGPASASPPPLPAAPVKCNAWDSKGRNPAMNVYVHLHPPGGASSNSVEAPPRCKLGILIQHALPKLAKRAGGYGQVALDWVTWVAERATGAPLPSTVAPFGMPNPAHWMLLQELAKEREVGAGTTSKRAPQPDSSEDLALRRAKETLMAVAAYFGPEAVAKVSRLTVRKLYQREYHFFDVDGKDVADSRRHALEWAVGLAEVEELLSNNADARAKLNERLTTPSAAAGGTGGGGATRKRLRAAPANGGSGRRVVVSMGGCTFPRSGSLVGEAGSAAVAPGLTGAAAGTGHTLVAPAAFAAAPAASVVQQQAAPASRTIMLSGSAAQQQQHLMSLLVQLQQQQQQQQQPQQQPHQQPQQQPHQQPHQQPQQQPQQQRQPEQPQQLLLQSQQPQPVQLPQLQQHSVQPLQPSAFHLAPQQQASVAQLPQQQASVAQLPQQQASVAQLPQQQASVAQLPQQQPGHLTVQVSGQLTAQQSGQLMPHHVGQVGMQQPGQVAAQHFVPLMPQQLGGGQQFSLQLQALPEAPPLQQQPQQEPGQMLVPEALAGALHFAGSAPAGAGLPELLHQEVQATPSWLASVALCPDHPVGPAAPAGRDGPGSPSSEVEQPSPVRTDPPAQRELEPPDLPQPTESPLLHPQLPSAQHQGQVQAGMQAQQLPQVRGAQQGRMELLPSKRPRMQPPGSTKLQLLAPQQGPGGALALPALGGAAGRSGPGSAAEVDPLDAALEAWEAHDRVNRQLGEVQQQLERQRQELAASERQRDALQRQLAQALSQLAQGPAPGSPEAASGGANSAAAAMAAASAVQAQLADLKALLPRSARFQLSQLLQQQAQADLAPHAAAICELGGRAVEAALAAYSASLAAPTSSPAL